MHILHDWVESFEVAGKVTPGWQVGALGCWDEAAFCDYQEVTIYAECMTCGTEKVLRVEQRAIAGAGNS